MKICNILCWFLHIICNQVTYFWHYWTYFWHTSTYFLLRFYIFYVTEDRIASPNHWTYSDVLFLTPFFAHVLDIIFVKICTILCWLLHILCHRIPYCQPHSLNIFRCLILSTILSTYSWHHLCENMHQSYDIFTYFWRHFYILYVPRMQKPPPAPSRQ